MFKVRWPPISGYDWAMWGVIGLWIVFLIIVVFALLTR
jgi:hypothetical protein